ncbi:MAG: sodium ion-translocating decarboxylase subunit beta [Spirochaetales bacterium]
MLSSFLESTAFAALTWQHLAMITVGCVLLYLGIARKYEPLLLVPIGFGAILVNLPLTGLLSEEGLLHYFYFGIESGIFPPLIFLGVGAMTDFGPLLAQPRTFLLGAAAQFGIFGTLIGARLLGFDFAESASIAIIGGADGPTAIYLTSRMASHLLGPIAVAAYSYMALVPVIQPPIIRLFTSKKERRIEMKEIRPVSRRVKIIFPIATTIAAGLVVPASVPLVGMLMLGNLFRESGVVNRLSETAQNELVNIVTILLATAVGSKMSAEEFLTLDTMLIIVLGLVAFSIGTASGVLLGKLMNVLSGGRINPMIGAAGVSAVPMAARVVQKIGQEENPKSFLLMHAMGPNVAGVIGSAVAAGVLLAIGG